ncbi:hypothetical protein LOK49_LG14G00860 [Camellia lanceoleosa]|uniref:Uncharacterized protein n=1 Tax=Camellia lanceoleosa TaxID=1840588 RepID=A0ACC0FD43_9ERIC|nr:hypothetical protein LOK49_LG14G00860 [Camellia lanceoleosa]
MLVFYICEKVASQALKASDWHLEGALDIFSDQIQVKSYADTRHVEELYNRYKGSLGSIKTEETLQIESERGVNKSIQDRGFYSVLEIYVSSVPSEGRGFENQRERRVGFKLNGGTDSENWVKKEDERMKEGIAGGCAFVLAVFDLATNEGAHLEA